MTGFSPGGQDDTVFNDLFLRAMFGLVSAPTEERESKLVCVRVLRRRCEFHGETKKLMCIYSPGVFSLMLCETGSFRRTMNAKGKGIRSWWVDGFEEAEHFCVNFSQPVASNR